MIVSFRTRRPFAFRSHISHLGSTEFAKTIAQFVATPRPRFPGQLDSRVDQAMVKVDLGSAQLALAADYRCMGNDMVLPL